MCTMMPLLLQMLYEMQWSAEAVHMNNITKRWSLSIILQFSTQKISIWLPEKMVIRFIENGLRPQKPGAHKGQLYCTTIKFSLQQSHGITKETQAKKLKQKIDHSPPKMLLYLHLSLCWFCPSEHKFSPLFSGYPVAGLQHFVSEKVLLCEWKPHSDAAYVYWFQF